jgi:hypothetical protein
LQLTFTVVALLFRVFYQPFQETAVYEMIGVVAAVFLVRLTGVAYHACDGNLFSVTAVLTGSSPSLMFTYVSTLAVLAVPFQSLVYTYVRTITFLAVPCPSLVFTDTRTLAVLAVPCPSLVFTDTRTLAVLAVPFQSLVYTYVSTLAVLTVPFPSLVYTFVRFTILHQLSIAVCALLVKVAVPPSGEVRFI